MDDFIKVCKTDDISDSAPLAVEIDGKPVALFRIAGKYYAIEDICPHQGSSFDGGSVDGDIVTCPLHGWKLNVVSGASLEAPGVTIETYEVRVAGNDVYVRL